MANNKKLSQLDLFFLIKLSLDSLQKKNLLLTKINLRKLYILTALKYLQKHSTTIRGFLNFTRKKANY